MQLAPHDLSSADKSPSGEPLEGFRTATPRRSERCLPAPGESGPHGPLGPTQTQSMGIPPITPNGMSNGCLQPQALSRGQLGAHIEGHDWLDSPWTCATPPLQLPEPTAQGKDGYAVSSWASPPWVFASQPSPPPSPSLPGGNDYVICQGFSLPSHRSRHRLPCCPKGMATQSAAG